MVLFLFIISAVLHDKQIQKKNIYCYFVLFQEKYRMHHDTMSTVFPSVVYDKDKKVDSDCEQCMSAGAAAPRFCSFSAFGCVFE